MTVVLFSKGIEYYKDCMDAEAVRKSLLDEYPLARLVEYKKGWAIQYYPSGYYYPEVPDSNSVFNPANW